MECNCNNPDEPRVVAVLKSLETALPGSLAILADGILSHARGSGPPQPSCVAIPPNASEFERLCLENACYIFGIWWGSCNDDDCRKAANEWYNDEVARCGTA